MRTTRLAVSRPSPRPEPGAFVVKERFKDARLQLRRNSRAVIPYLRQQQIPHKVDFELDLAVIANGIQGRSQSRPSKPG